MTENYQPTPLERAIQEHPPRWYEPRNLSEWLGTYLSTGAISYSLYGEVFDGQRPIATRLAAAAIYIIASVASDSADERFRNSIIEAYSTGVDVHPIHVALASYTSPRTDVGQMGAARIRDVRFIKRTVGSLISAIEPPVAGILAVGNILRRAKLNTQVRQLERATQIAQNNS